MTTPLAKPSTIVEPFAINGQKNTIPTTTATPGAASLDQGFPALTMTPVQQGGVPPSGKDFNGLFNWITQHLAWLNAGGQYTFDATLAAFIGGYPVGMVLQSDDGLSSYVNVQAGNAANFNTDPTQIGVTWMPNSGAAVAPAGTTVVATSGGTTVLTGAQAARRIIKVTGTLTSNANIIVPSTLARDWLVINATTGAFSVNVAPSGGASVAVTQGGRDYLFSDGATMSFSQSDAAQAALGNNSTRIANTAFVVAAIAAALVNTALTGNPTAPTQAVNNNSTSIATTAYADRAVSNYGAISTPAYIKANATALQAGDFWTDTRAGGFTLVLPDPPIGANPLRVQDITGSWSATNPLTINPGTKTIMGFAGPVEFNMAGALIELWYDTTTNDWRTV